MNKPVKIFYGLSIGGETEWVKYIPQDDDPLVLYRDTIPYLYWHCDDGPTNMNFIFEDNIDDDIKQWTKSVKWVSNNLLHRVDGPAEIYYSISKKNPDGTCEWVESNADWVLFGEEIDEKEYKSWLKEMGMDINNLSNEDKVMIDLKWNTDE